MWPSVCRPWPASQAASTSATRVGALPAVGAGLAAIVLAVLHLATSDGGPGTGNGLVGAIVAVPLGLLALVLGRRALTRSRTTARTR